MTPAELTTPEQVIAGLRAADKPALMAELARRAAAALGLDRGAVLDALQSRERLGSTGLGRGFALPHAHIPGLGRFFGLFARLARPIDFEAIDGAPVDLVFLLLGPENAGKNHLAALAAISRPLRDPAFMQSLRRAKDATALYGVLNSPPPPPDK
jgi:PTS system nitrogen regulatory IIA component